MYEEVRAAGSLIKRIAEAKKQKSKAAEDNKLCH